VCLCQKFVYAPKVMSQSAVGVAQLEPPPHLTDFQSSPHKKKEAANKYNNKNNATIRQKPDLCHCIRFGLLVRQCNFDCPWKWGSVSHARPFANLVMVSCRGMTTIGGLTYSLLLHTIAQMKRQLTH